MSNDLALVNNPLSVGSLGSYIHWANTIPLLTQEEETELATRLRDHNDIEAARRLILSHLRFVIRVARGYNGYGLPMADLIQEGNIGLMKAVKRFDPAVGVRLVSFAIHWVRAEMHEYILRNWRIVKIATTKAQRKLFFNLRKMSKKLGWLSESEANMMADELKVSIKDVRQMEARLRSTDASFDGYDDDDQPSLGWNAPAHYLEDKSNNPSTVLEQSEWANDQEEQLYGAMQHLDERSQDILKARWLSEKKQTLHDLAAKYSVSAERIRQIEKVAMGKLREAIAA